MLVMTFVSRAVLNAIKAENKRRGLWVRLVYREEGDPSGLYSVRRTGIAITHGRARLTRVEWIDLPKFGGKIEWASALDWLGKVDQKLRLGGEPIPLDWSAPGSPPRKMMQA